MIISVIIMIWEILTLTVTLTLLVFKKNTVSVLHHSNAETFPPFVNFPVLEDVCRHTKKRNARQNNYADLKIV